MKYAVLLLVLTILPVLGAQAAVDGFTVDTVQNPASQPRAMAFAPDGRLFYTEFLTGNIRIIATPTTAPTLLATPFATVTALDTTGPDCGLHGIAFDPAFASNGFVYVAHTTGPGSNPRLVIKRFEETSPDIGTNETTIYGPIAMGAAGENHGGRIVFGLDGKLYVGVGDGASSVSFGGANAQNATDERGKILRIESDGQIPVDNPSVGSAVYALGLRNPRGLAFNPTNNDLFVTDTGNPLASGDDELNRILASGNYGWDTNGQSGDQSNPSYTNPAWIVPDPGSPTFDTPSAVAFYPSSFSPPPTNPYPAAGFRGGAAYLASEAASGAILRVLLHGADEAVGIASRPFASFPQAVTDIVFGPDAALYVATQGVIYRVWYSGQQAGTSPPTADAGTDFAVDEDAAATLNGTGTTDPDLPLDILSYTWRQVGGSPTVTIIDPTLVTATFTAPLVTFTQTLTFELLVTDTDGGADSDFVIVTVNNISNPEPPGEDSGWEDRVEGGCIAAPAGIALLMPLALLLLGARRRRRIR